MSPETKEQVIKRLKSLAWRVGMMALAGVFSIATEFVTQLDLNPAVVVVLGLILGEVSKYLNSYQTEVQLG